MESAIYWVLGIVVTWPIAGVVTGYICWFFARRKIYLILGFYGHPLSWAHLGWVVFFEMIVGAPLLLFLQYTEKNIRENGRNA